VLGMPELVENSLGGAINVTCDGNFHFKILLMTVAAWHLLSFSLGNIPTIAILMPAWLINRKLTDSMIVLAICSQFLKLLVIILLLPAMKITLLGFTGIPPLLIRHRTC
jgi:hypothetical protein